MLQIKVGDEVWARHPKCRYGVVGVVSSVSRYSDTEHAITVVLSEGKYAGEKVFTTSSKVGIIIRNTTPGE